LLLYDDDGDFDHYKLTKYIWHFCIFV